MSTTYSPAKMNYERMRTLWRLKHADYRQARDDEWKARMVVEHLDEHMGSEEFAKMGAADFAQHYLGLVTKAADALNALNGLAMNYNTEFDAANQHLLEE
jgi:hypothetical protein